MARRMSKAPSMLVRTWLTCLLSATAALAQESRGPAQMRNSPQGARGAAFAAPPTSRPVDPDWPTAGHDMQRTSWGAGCPTPPFRYRWAWANGERLQPADLKSEKFLLAPVGLLPDRITTRFMALAQPVVQGSTAYIGSTDGEIFAIDLATGQTRWKAVASGRILHSLSIGPATIAATASSAPTAMAIIAATTGGIDAFSTKGEGPPNAKYGVWGPRRLWRFAPKLDGFWTCPAIAGGLVLAGSIGGTFYAIDIASGQPRWSRKIGASIYHCPAVTGQTVLFGAENMHAYCLRLADGELIWESDQTIGSTFGHHWPVVVQGREITMFRTNSLTGIWNSFEAVNRAPHDYLRSQQALRKYYQDNPRARNLYCLGLADGKERLFVCTGQYSGMGDVPPLPVVRPDGSVLASNYSREGAFLEKDEFKAWGRCLDVGQVDFQTGLFAPLGPPGSRVGPLDIYRADYPTAGIFGGGGYLLFYNHALGLWCEPLEAKGPRWGAFSNLCAEFQKLGKSGCLGEASMFPGWICPAVTAEVIVANPFGTCVVAWESTREKK